MVTQMRSRHGARKQIWRGTGEPGNLRKPRSEGGGTGSRRIKSRLMTGGRGKRGRSQGRGQQGAV
eukprot:749301-Hanusia_phi.AAC.1